MIALDSTCLLLFLSKIAHVPTDKKTGNPITFAHERIENLIHDFDQNKTKILIPTPVLAECLVHAGPAREKYIEILQKYSVFRIVNFDSKAAIELSIMTEKALNAGDKRDGLTSPWAKVKFDRQIIAICKVEGAQAIYSDDADIEKLGEINGISVISLASCPLPPGMRQANLFESTRLLDFGDEMPQSSA